MKQAEFDSDLRNLLSEEEVKINGGVLPLIPIAIAFGKGFVAGVSVAGTVHMTVQAIDKMTS